MNVLTFDVEEWFNFFQEKEPVHWDKYEVRIHKNLDFILETLSNHQYKATFFCIGWLAERHPTIVKKIDQLGHEIGSHSYYHQLAHRLSHAEFEEDLKSSINALEDITGKKITMYRAPGFSIKKSNIWVFEKLLEFGIEIDSSLTAVHSETGGLEEFNISSPCILKVGNHEIKEFPLNYSGWGNLKVNFTGGGYFRAFPYSLIQRLFQNSLYNLVYFHPRDFDKNQPVIKAPLKRLIKNYIGLKGARKKFIRLITEHDFVDIKVASENIEWNKAIKHNLTKF